jgi:flagellar biosynthesis chaperone FliJ
MKQAFANRQLARLVALRNRKEDQALQNLAQGQASLTKADDNLAQEAGYLQRMESALPAFFKQHLQQVTVLKRPADRVASLFAAAQADRHEVAVQSHVTADAKEQCVQAATRVEGLRLAYLAALRQRQATEALSDIRRRRQRQRQELLDEDLASDPGQAVRQGEKA